MHEKAVKELLAEFAGAVEAQDRCIGRGDAQSGNRHAELYVAAGKELLRRGTESVDKFTILLSHDNPSVRVMAASFLLETKTELAVAALKSVAAGAGLASLGAQMTLQRYERIACSASTTAFFSGGASSIARSMARSSRPRRSR
jgi:hypothetical protein